MLAEFSFLKQSKNDALLLQEPVPKMPSSTTSAAIILLFVQLWVNLDPRFFRIHGLWPNDQNGSWPQFCGNEAFNESALTGILPQLERYWSGFELNETLNDSESFWQHEWTKHGTCAALANPDLSSEVAYFTEALALRYQYPALDMLAAIGITPTNGRWTQSDAIAKWVAKYGVAPILSCDHKHLLIDLRLCIDPTTMLSMNCSAGIQQRASEHCGFYFIL
jgi:ribonuclease I